jgi:hypothetical protein
MAGSKPSGRDEVLAHLIADQARDDAKTHSVGGTRVVNESCFAGALPDGPGLLDSIADPGPGPAELIEAAELVELGDPTAAARRRAGRLTGLLLLGLDRPWTGPVVEYSGKGPCPVCGPGTPPRGTACLCCSASHEDPKRHPMAGTRPPARRSYRKPRGKSGKELAGGLGT